MTALQALSFVVSGMLVGVVLVYLPIVIRAALFHNPDSDSDIEG